MPLCTWFLHGSVDVRRDNNLPQQCKLNRKKKQNVVVLFP